MQWCLVFQVQVDEMTQRCAAMDREKKHVQHELNSLKQTVEKHKVRAVSKYRVLDCAHVSLYT